jgi:hypothetical protein
LRPEPKEDTIWSVNDKPKNNIAGKNNKTCSMRLIFLCSRGKNKENRRNEGGITPEVAKPILPQNSFEDPSSRK